MQMEDLQRYYYEKFIPAYADAVASLGDKPVQLLIEQENTLAHIFAHLEGESDGSNLKKAIAHLERATLDCYKIIWIEYKERLKSYISLDNSNLALAFNKEESELLAKIKKIDTLAREARELESLNVGKNTTKALEKYMEVVALEKELLDSVDIKKVSSYNQFQLKNFLQDQYLGLILGILGGLVSSYIYAKLF
jgi:hypothetical protein